MSIRQPDPALAWNAWQNPPRNSIQRIARDLTPLVPGAPYSLAAVHGALRQAQAILGAGGELLGPELITNGAFAADTDWFKSAGWTIALGVASCDGTAGSILSQTIAHTPGLTYRITGLTANGTYAAGLRIVVGGVIGVFVTADGAFSFDVVGGAGDVVFQSSALNDFIGDLDNVSVKELIA